MWRIGFFTLLITGKNGKKVTITLLEVQVIIAGGNKVTINDTLHITGNTYNSNKVSIDTFLITGNNY